MISAITLILAFQLAGEVAARALGVPVPGPVLGMVLLLAALVAIPGLAARLAPTTQALLAHMSLLFVPAGVGVIGHLDALGADGPAILLALFASTVLAIAVGALAFVGLSRLVGARDD